MSLKMYMGFSAYNGSSEGACLIFAHNSKEAVKLARPVLDSWMMLEDFTDARAKLIRGADYLYKEADKLKLENDEPHVIETPKCCKVCECWGTGIINEEGLCESCLDIEATL